GTPASFTNTGAINIANARTLTFNSGTLNQDIAGTIAGAGTLSLNSVTANLATNFSNSTTGLALNSTTVNGPGTLTNTAAHTLTLYYSTVAAPFINQGTLVMRGTNYLTGAAGSFTTTGG